MTTKTINIKNDKALEILKSLENIGFIEFADNNKSIYLKSLKPKNQSKNDSFWDIIGIWKERDITLKQLREKAWPQRK